MVAKFNYESKLNKQNGTNHNPIAQKTEDSFPVRFLCSQ